MKNSVLPFDEVKKGMTVYNCEDNDVIGTVIRLVKPTDEDYDEIIEMEMENWGFDEEEMAADEFNWIYINTDGWDGGKTLFNYDGDPCGVYAKTK